MFQDDPWLAFDVLGIARPVGGTPLDRRGEIERKGREPLAVRQGFPDLVLVYRDPADETRGIVITVEAQSELDRAKRWSVPVYQSHLAQDHELACWAVVVSLDRAMSRAMREWARGDPPRIDALLIDVDSVSKAWLDDPDRPMAAVLVGILHGYAGDFDAARRGFHAALSLPLERRERHAITVLAALPEDQANQLIGELPMQEQDKWLEIERTRGIHHVWRRKGLEEGRKEGLEEGRTEGREEGRKEGREEGRKEGRAEARAALVELVFDLLRDRDVAVDPDSEARIRACVDLPTLKRWAKRSIEVTRVDELFEG